jgi:lysozyme family protein
MQENFLASLKEVLRHEGGYVNHPKDPGGATNRGVTQATYDGYRRLKRQLPRSVKFIVDAEVADCYKQLYWDKVCGDALPRGIDFAVFDAAVNSGPAKGELWLQQAINRVAGKRRLKEDGQLGPASIDAADDYPSHLVIDAMVKIRLTFMQRLGIWSTFGAGWSNRLLGELDKRTKVRAANGVLQVASAMAAKNIIDLSPSGALVAEVKKTPLPAAAMARPQPGLLARLFA